jgi:hypothetical protein
MHVTFHFSFSRSPLRQLSNPLVAIGWLWGLGRRREKASKSEQIVWIFFSLFRFLIWGRERTQKGNLAPDFYDMGAKREIFGGG